MYIYIDLDGTLTDVFPRYCGILNLFLKVKGIERSCFTVSEYKILRHAGYSDIDILKNYYTFIEEKEFRRFKQSNLEDLSWLEKDILIDNPAKLKEYHNNYILITQRRNRKNAEAQIDDLGLNKIFDEIVIVTPVIGQNSKLIYLQEKAGKNDCIIGDSYIELECARKLGMNGFFVKTGLFGTQIVENEHICENYIECVRIIDQMKKE